jgi:hypothetical protein
MGLSLYNTHVLRCKWVSMWPWYSLVIMLQTIEILNFREKKTEYESFLLSSQSKAIFVFNLQSAVRESQWIGLRHAYACNRIDEKLIPLPLPCTREYRRHTLVTAIIRIWFATSNFMVHNLLYQFIFSRGRASRRTPKFVLRSEKSSVGHDLLLASCLLNTVQVSRSSEIKIEIRSTRSSDGRNKKYVYQHNSGSNSFNNRWIWCGVVRKPSAAGITRGRQNMVPRNFNSPRGEFLMLYDAL